MSAIETVSSNYTHIVCGQCGSTLYCSEAEPWQPQTEFGWCQHSFDDPEGVFTEPPSAGFLHDCNGEMRA